MRVEAQSAQGARVVLDEQALGRRVELRFDFRAGEDDVAPLFSGPSWGTMIWDASLSMASFLETYEPPREEAQDRAQGQARRAELGKVVELGACCGLPGLVCAARGASKVVLTDLQEYATAMKSSLASNAEVLAGADVSMQPLFWSKANAGAFVQQHGHADLILAAECVSTDVYGRQSWEALVEVIATLVRPKTGCVLLCSHRRPNDGLDDFLALLLVRFQSSTIHKLAAAESAQGYVDLYELRDPVLQKP